MTACYGAATVGIAEEKRESDEATRRKSNEMLMYHAKVSVWFGGGGLTTANRGLPLLLTIAGVVPLRPTPPPFPRPHPSPSQAPRCPTRHLAEPLVLVANNPVVRRTQRAVVHVSIVVPVG